MSKRFRRHPELKRLEGGWRRPKTRTNKVRRKLKGKKPMPSQGYGTPKSLKHKHPSGLTEVIVSNPKELENIKKDEQCVRISGSVGSKKRMEIIKRASELGIKVLNPNVRVVKNVASSEKK